MIETRELYRYLRSQYAGVFDERQLERHIGDYVGLKIATQQVKQLLRRCGRGSRILDIGSGFGSFVLTARRHGLDAVGIDIAPFEVEFARERLLEEAPGDDPEYVYRLGSGLDLSFMAESFDVITLWNVLEHVSDYRRLLSEVVRVLRPGGHLYAVCPNYASFRQEAHYHIFWPSLLPRKLAGYYLRLRGKDPAFFESSIFYRTNWGVLVTLRRLGMKVYDLNIDKLNDLDGINNRRVRQLLVALNRFKLLWIVRFGLVLAFYNPLKSSVILYARK